MWENRHSVFGNHLRYIHNEIIKPYNVMIVEYYECMYEILDIFQYIYSPNSKSKEHHQARYKAQDIKLLE